jgi:hypothetical protein
MIVIPAQAGIHSTAARRFKAVKISETAFQSESCSTVDPGLRECNPIGVRRSGTQIGGRLRKNADHVIPAKAGIYCAASL